VGGGGGAMIAGAASRGPAIAAVAVGQQQACLLGSRVLCKLCITLQLTLW
jgi:hypothetical protein